MADQMRDKKGDQASPVLPGPGLRPGGGRAARFRGPVVKPKNFKGTLKRLWQYFGRERKWLSIIFAFIVTDSVVTLVLLYDWQSSRRHEFKQKQGGFNSRTDDLYSDWLISCRCSSDFFAGVDDGGRIAADRQKSAQPPFSKTAKTAGCLF